MRIEIAGTEVDDPLAFVRTYVRKKERAVRRYDLHEQDDPNLITARDVLAVQYLDPSLDGMELQSFVDASRKAPWLDVPVDARLQDADPEEEGGLYDAAEDLYRVFRSGHRATPVSKIHKVLHLKRPRLYPLFGGRLEAIYEERASEVSRRVEGRRGKRGRLYWAAIREDLLRAGDAWDELRGQLEELSEPESLGAQLSDVRLHDILCWQLAPGPLR